MTLAAGAASDPESAPLRRSATHGAGEALDPGRLSRRILSHPGRPDDRTTSRSVPPRGAPGQAATDPHPGRPDDRTTSRSVQPSAGAESAGLRRLTCALVVCEAAFERRPEPWGDPDVPDPGPDPPRLLRDLVLPVGTEVQQAEHHLARGPLRRAAKLTRPSTQIDGPMLPAESNIHPRGASAEGTSRGLHSIGRGSRAGRKATHGACSAGASTSSARMMPLPWSSSPPLSRRRRDRTARRQTPAGPPGAGHPRWPARRPATIASRASDGLLGVDLEQLVGELPAAMGYWSMCRADDRVRSGFSAASSRRMRLATA